jgi:hypothetical protein
LQRIRQIAPKRAPFYPLPAGLGKRKAMLFLRERDEIATIQRRVRRRR